MTPWKSNVGTIRDGTPVDAPTTNVPIQDLTQRTQHLKDAINAALLGQAIVERDAPLSDTTTVGMPVYKDSDGTWKPAKAEIDDENVLGNLTLKRSSYVQGIIAEKSSNTLGIVVLLGKVPIALGSVIEGEVATGQYYLSATTPGKITLQRPPIGLAVLYYAAELGEAFVNPAPKDVLQDHIHFRVSLYAHPAGIPKCISSGTHEISCPDSNSTGWLPASHAIFNGNAPAGAAFGYNLLMHPELAAVWPPLPHTMVDIFVDGVLVHVADAPGDGVDVVADKNGLWWMSAAYGEAPWQDPWVECALGGNCLAIIGTDDDYDGYYDTGVEKRIELYFIRMSVLTDQTAVTSLNADAPFEFVDAFGNEKSAGNLKLTLNGDILETANDELSSVNSVRRISGRTAYVGPNVTRIRPGNSLIQVSSANGNITDGFYGDVVLTGLDAASAGGFECDISTIALNGAVEDAYLGVPMLSFPKSILSTLNFKVAVPTGYISTSGYIQLILWLYAVNSGDMPELGISYRRIAVPGSGEISSLPAFEIAVPGGNGPNSGYRWINNSASPTVTSGGVVKLTLNSILVGAGELIQFTIKRDARASGGTLLDTYASVLGLLRIVPLLKTTA